MTVSNYVCKECGFKFILGEPSKEEMEKREIKPKIECPKCGSENTELQED